jgi:hypothetical protein
MQHGGKQSKIEHPKLKHTFVITDCPLLSNLDSYKSSLEKVTHLIRLCEPTYPAESLLPIIVHDEFAIADGTTPSVEIVKAYLDLLDSLPGLIHPC